MKDFDVKEHIRAALEPADERYLPSDIMQEWEPQECLGRDGATLLMISKSNGIKAVAKIFSKQEIEAEIWDTLATLEHPYLPKVIRSYSEGDQVIILREFIEGETLIDHLAGKVYSEDETVRIGLMMCDVLGYLHAQTPPIIHRDVKPENILIRPNGSIALIDFGIARKFDKDATQDTHVMGTQCFAPPEQYGFAQTDRRSDLYALGMVLLWMLTGSVQTENASDIQSAALRSVIEKCTSFSPKDRFVSAQELKKALVKCRRPARSKMRLMIPAACILIIAAVICIMCGRSNVSKICFSEPLIEQCIRTQLGKSEDEKLTPEELAGIEGVYLFGDAVATDQDGFYTAAGNWYSSGTKAHGPVISLEDLSQLPNLRYVMIAAQHITDLSPLKDLSNLEKIEFKHNSISDITPIEGMAHLASVGLNDNPISDVSTLSSLPELRFLDLCDASAYDPAVLEDLGDMEFLDISNRTDSWKHLGTRSIRVLKLGWSGIDTLDAIANVSGLETLELQHTSITSLQGLEAHTSITELRIEGCSISDLSPLKLLPNLQHVKISEDMRSAMEELGDVGFEVEYE